MNEILIICSVPLIYGSVLVAYRLFGKTGLFAMTVICTVFANIEVLILVDAFGIGQTLGNVIFAATYLITDILSENESRKDSNRAVSLGIFASVFMLIITQYWFLYSPSAEDWAAEHVRALFSMTPRLMLASLLGYAVSQRFDVWLYHKLWDRTTARSGSSRPFLWLRNNAATLTAQIVNTVMFNMLAFAGVYDWSLLGQIILSGYVIYICTSLLDTPAVYAARRMKEKGLIPD